MKKVFLPIIIFIAVTAFCFEKKHTSTKLDSIKWVIGSWITKTKQGTIIESWSIKNDSSYLGKSVLVKAHGGPDILENLELVSRNRELFYLSRVNGQNNNQQLKFKITFFNDSKFVAEKPDHDFPKRITYSLINKDSIHAYIDGGPAMPEKKSDFYFSRYKN